jgi:acyl dehydratase
LDFGPGLVLLKEARNVTYKSFVMPGQTLTVESVCQELTPEQSVFAATGSVGERGTVKGRLTLRHLRLSDLDSGLAETEAQLRAYWQALFARLCRGGGVTLASGA